LAKLTIRKIEETFLELSNPESGLYSNNHIFEPEFHQEEYVDICRELENTDGSYTISQCKELIGTIHRGTQPKYADIESEPDSLYWNGMTDDLGNEVDDDKANVCALKSISVRAGFIDLETARSVTKETYKKTMHRAGIQKNDILINSTGDGTIGRVAIFNHDFPAVVDGHITILRFKNEYLAWYIGAFLMSEQGQKQIIRYINGSSGQVEIYPQDIARIWIKPASKKHIKKVATDFKDACNSYKKFKQDIKKALSSV